MVSHDAHRVTPFGYPRITGCVLLPTAFRSLPRPSSPDGSKASTHGPSFLLDHITSRHFSLSSFFLPFSSNHLKPVKDHTLTCRHHRSLKTPAVSAHRFTLSLFSAFTRAPEAARLRRLEVWGFEPQPYGLQSHRSGQLSYTPPSLPTFSPARGHTVKAPPSGSAA